ncbi:hypothetical protein BGP_6682 [Beggiatoa sp. PS]|nr:hypothetical protein BGP_6682 [Beggiatoa sp. PS]
MHHYKYLKTRDSSGIGKMINLFAFLKMKPKDSFTLFGMAPASR